MDTRPIGLLDSGVGGLSIWRSVKALLPHESIQYIGDNAFIPYSKKSKREILSRVCKLIAFLIHLDCKLIVVACNTATVMGIDHYRKIFPNIPILGIVPVIKTAAFLTKKNHIGIFSTYRTATSAYQKRLIHEFARDCLVENIGNHTLVPLIEKGHTHGDTIQTIIEKSLGPMVRNGVDVIVLGCSHYSFIEDEIREVVGENVAILESSGAVARHVERVLVKNNMLSLGKTVSYVFRTTGDASQVSRVASQLLGKPIKFHHVKV